MENTDTSKEKHTTQTTNDGLFLLEVFIDKVCFEKRPCFSDMDFRTCVTIAAPAIQMLEICDDELGACVAKTRGPFVKTFNNGKSCLFSLPEAEITKNMRSFPIKVTVHKCPLCGRLPTKIMGITTINMTKEFVESRNKYNMFDPASVNCQALKDSFKIVSAEDGERVGDILMFLRISCFGKLIVTKFQAVGQLHSETGRGTLDTGPICPRGGNHGGGPCRLTQDPYNSALCQDPDDICYCSDSKPSTKQPMVCRNMDQYCVPKCILPRWPMYQDLTEEQILEMKSKNMELKLLHVEDNYNNSSITGSSIPSFKTPTIGDEYSESLTDTRNSTESIQAKSDHSSNSNSLCAIRSKRRSVTFSDKVDYASKSDNSFPNNRQKCCNDMSETKFGKNATAVYMTLVDDLCRCRTSGTQATAFVNQCLQASQSKSNIKYNTNNHFVCNGTHNSIVNSSLTQDSQMKYSDIYFFGKNKRDKPHKEKVKKGVESTKLVEIETCSQVSSHTSVLIPEEIYSSATAVQAQPANNTASIQCYTACRGKTISIKNRPRKPCPGVAGNAKGDVKATVSQIKIVPRKKCPVHGKEPYQGPKCIIAPSGVKSDGQGAVKVSTVPNTRQGVFELVIHKLSGAPLAKKELMLEWTPPPCQPPTFRSPCPIQRVLTPGCRSSKCKMIVCRPSSCRPVKFTTPCRSTCGNCSRTTCDKPCSSCKPCGSCVPAYRCKPCPTSLRCTRRSRPCSPCAPPCRTSCSPGRSKCRPSRCRPYPPLPGCKPCPPPPRCRPCPPLPRCTPCPLRCKPCPSKPCEACRQLCGSLCCDLPCKSSSCLQPCPIRYRKCRKIRCKNKIRPHRKLISPCLNRSKACPMVRCRSVSGPCVGCCGAPPFVPRKCSSVFPWQPRKCSVNVIHSLNNFEAT